MALLPVLFAAGTLLSAHYLDERRRSVIGDVLSNWYFVAVFGSVVIVPVLVVSLCGAAALSPLVLSRASVGDGGVYGSVAGCWCVHLRRCRRSVLRWQAPNSWTPSLSVVETPVFTTPFAVIAAANMRVLIRLWTRGPSTQSNTA